MPMPLTRRQILASAAATAAVAAMPAAAIAAVEQAPMEGDLMDLIVHRDRFARIPASPEIRAFLKWMPSGNDHAALNAYLEPVYELARQKYQSSTYPRRWIDGVTEWTDVGTKHFERRFVFGEEYDDDPVADAAALVGRCWFIPPTPKNWALIDSLPQRAEVSIVEYMAFVTELEDHYERRWGDKGPAIYICWSDTGHRHFEVPYSAACGGFPEKYAPAHLRLPVGSA